EVFGEMSLLTGEPRQASCTAVTEVRCYLVDYSLARRVLAARPEMAVEISAELARRLDALAGERAHLAASAEEPGPGAPARLLARMKVYSRLGGAGPTGTPPRGGRPSPRRTRPCSGRGDA